MASGKLHFGAGGGLWWEWCLEKGTTVSDVSKEFSVIHMIHWLVRGVLSQSPKFASFFFVPVIIFSPFLLCK